MSIQLLGFCFGWFLQSNHCWPKITLLRPSNLTRAFIITLRQKGKLSRSFWKTFGKATQWLKTWYLKSDKQEAKTKMASGRPSGKKARTFSGNIVKIFQLSLWFILQVFFSHPFPMYYSDLCHVHRLFSGFSGDEISETTVPVALNF